MVPPFVHRVPVTIGDVAHLVPNTLRFLMLWSPSSNSERIRRMVWAQENLSEDALRGRYLADPSGSYIYFPPHGGGRFMRTLPDEIGEEDVFRIDPEDGYESPLVLNLKKYKTLIEGTQLEDHYAEPIDYVLRCVAEESLCAHRPALSVRSYITSSTSDPGMSSIVDQLANSFSAFRVSGQILGYCLMIANFGQSIKVGLEKFSGGESFTAWQVAKLANAFGLYMSLLGSALDEKGDLEFIRKTAMGLVEGFSAPTFDHDNFLLRNLAVRSLGEYLYSSGEGLVKQAKNAKHLSEFYYLLYYAYPSLMASFICFDRASQYLLGDEKVKLARAGRLSDELAARVYTALLGPSLIAPETFCLMVTEHLINDARKGKRDLRMALVDVFDSNFIYPEFFREEMVAEVARYRGGAQFSSEYTAFVREQFHGVPRSAPSQ